MIRFRFLLLVLGMMEYCSPQSNCPQSHRYGMTMWNCTGMGLPTKIDVEVNYVDLSRNNFVKLQNDFFKSFIKDKLKHIVLANCEIQEVEENAFINLHNLKYLDLSSNNIKSINPASFKLQRLLTLSLSHNPLHILKSRSFDSIPSLGVLHLSSCSLTEIERDAFLNVPSLRKVSLNNNQLTKLPNMAFSSLKRPKLLLSGNPWVCDCHLKWLKNLHTQGYSELEVGRCNRPPRLFDDMPLEEFACAPIITHPHSNVDKASVGVTNETLSCKVKLAEEDEVSQVKWTWTVRDRNNSNDDDHYRNLEGELKASTTSGEWSNLTVNIQPGELIVYTCNVSNPGGSDSRSFTYTSTTSEDSTSIAEKNNWITITTAIIITITVTAILAIIWCRQKGRSVPEGAMYQPREDLIYTEETVANPVEKPPRLYEKRPPDASEINGLLYSKKEEDDEFDRVSVASVTTASSHQPHCLYQRYTPDLLTFPDGFSTMYLPSNSPSPPSVILPHTQTHSSIGRRRNSEDHERVRSPHVPLSRFGSTPTLFNYCISPTREVPYGTRRSSYDTSSLYNYRPLPPVPQTRRQQYPHHMYRSLPRGGVHRPPATIPRGGTMPRTLSAEALIQHNRHASQHRIPPNTRRYAPPSVLYETDNETYESIV